MELMRNDRVRSDGLAECAPLEIVNHLNTDSATSENIQMIKENEKNDNNHYFTKNTAYEHAEREKAIKYMKEVAKATKCVVDQNLAKPKNYEEWTSEQQYDHIMANTKTYFPEISDTLSILISGKLHRGDCGRNPTDKPHWLDIAKFRKGQKFAQDHILSIFFSNLLSFFLIFSVDDSLKSIIFSGQSYTPYLAFKRYLSTICRVRNWLTEDPWAEDTSAHKDIQTVRRMHRAIRSRMCKCDDESFSAAVKMRIPNAWCPDRESILRDFSACPSFTMKDGIVLMQIRAVGMNQAEMALTQFAFMGLIMLYPRDLGVFASEDDLDAFCHLWRCLGYLLGIEDEYNFCNGSLVEIKKRSRELIETVLKLHLRQVTPEWEHMLRCLIEGIHYYIACVTFKMVLLQITSIINIDMPRIKNTLTYFQRLRLAIIHFIFRYVMRLGFVRRYLNKIMNKLIVRATKLSPEEHKILEMRSTQSFESCSI